MDTQFDLFETTVSDPVLAAKTYEAFRDALASSGCQKCELGRTRTHIVIDRGNPCARVLFIGEAPGENEDLQGRAFVGRAGQLLDRMLQEAGLDADQDSLIANIAKCRPPGNRAPASKEAAACFPYLQKQIDLIKPRFILLLGATALKHILPEKAKTPMANLVGNFFGHPRYPGIDFMVLFHPAYLLRDPRKKPAMLEHLTRFKTRWEETKAA